MAQATSLALTPASPRPAACRRRWAPIASRLLRAHVHAQTHRCTDAKMHRCKDAQMQRCTDAQTHRRTDAQMRTHAHARAHAGIVNAHLRECTSGGGPADGLPPQAKGVNTGFNYVGETRGAPSGDLVVVQACGRDAPVSQSADQSGSGNWWARPEPTRQ